MPVRYFTLNDAGLPVQVEDMFDWAVWFETADEHRQLADDYVTIEDGTAVRVSTVFLGFSVERGPPLLWETRVFGGDLDKHNARYLSRSDALTGHSELLALVLAEAKTGADGRPVHTSGKEHRAAR